MRTLAGMVVGITLVTVWHILGWPVIGWLFTRIPPVTPRGHTPRHRTWEHGIEVTPWHSSESA